MKLPAIAFCHSERSEESLIASGSTGYGNTPRCFASLNMTAQFTRGIVPNVIAAVVIAALSPSAWANEAYKFDPSSSAIGFTVHQFLGTTHGKFTRFSGKIDIDREHPENSSVTAQIDVRSIDTHIKKRDDHLRSPEFFNVEKFPQITFRSRSVKRTGPQSGDILLTPINETSRTRWAVTTEPISRGDFNLMFAQAAEAVSGISQTVALNIEIEAKRSQ